MVRVGILFDLRHCDAQQLAGMSGCADAGFWPMEKSSSWRDSREINHDDGKVLKPQGGVGSVRFRFLGIGSFSVLGSVRFVDK